MTDSMRSALARDWKANIAHRASEGGEVGVRGDGTAANGAAASRGGEGDGVGTTRAEALEAGGAHPHVRMPRMSHVPRSTLA